MATKPVNKKKPAKLDNASMKRESDVAKETASVIPFNPLGSMGQFAEQFTPSTPSFGGASMESMMNNYKDQYEKMSGEAASSMRESMETITKGTEAMMKTVTEAAQESAQRNAESIKALMASRTINEFAEAQNKLAQKNFDEMMSAVTKMSEMSIKMWTEALEPISSQMTKAMNSASSAVKKNAA